MSSLQQNWSKGQNKFCLEVRGERRERVGEEGRGEEMTQILHAIIIIIE
jgi:hypothetical protein